MTSGVTPKSLLCPSCGGALDPDARPCPQCGTVVFTRRCAVCFDLNAVDDRNCRSCGALLPPEDETSRPEKLGCPGCGARMTPRRSGSAAFDECDHCGGLWLTPATIEEMAAQAETRANLKLFDPPAAAVPAGGPTPSTVLYRKCPLCDKMMNRSAYAAGAGVVVDLCKNHGTYFDSGELTRVFTFIESGGLEKANRREAEALKSELRDLRRKAIYAGGADTPLPLEYSPEPVGIHAIDLLRGPPRAGSRKTGK